jgi:hypothetical protein
VEKKSIFSNSLSESIYKKASIVQRLGQLPAIGSTPCGMILIFLSTSYFLIVLLKNKKIRFFNQFSLLINGRSRSRSRQAASSEAVQ